MTKDCLAVRHVAFEDLGLLGPLVSARGYDTRWLDAGVDPIDAAALVEPDLVVVLGGPIGVYEARHLSVRHRRNRRDCRAAATNKPMLGICLGAQMMAAALGARVAPGPVKEIGWAPLTLTRGRPGFRAGAARRDTRAALAWRQLRLAGGMRTARVDGALPGPGVPPRAVAACAAVSY